MSGEETLHRRLHGRPLGLIAAGWRRVVGIGILPGPAALVTVVVKLCVQLCPLNRRVRRARAIDVPELADHDWLVETPVRRWVDEWRNAIRPSDSAPVVIVMNLVEIEGTVVFAADALQ